MYKPQYKSILTSKGSNLVSSGLPSGNQQKGSQSQTNIKITSQQYSNNSIGQLKTNDQPVSSMIPPFESQVTSSSRQLSHAEVIGFFKKSSENNPSKSNNQKTQNNNSKLGQTNSPVGLQNGSSNSKLGNQNQASQSTTTITPFNKYSQNYLSKVKNISLGQQQSQCQQFSSTSQLKVSQNGFFKQQALNSQQDSLQKQETAQTQAKQQNNTNSNTSFQSQNQPQQTLQIQQNSKNIQTRHAQLDLFDVSKEQNHQKQTNQNSEETQDEQAFSKQQQQKKDVSENEYEKASSALQTLKSKMKRGESQNGEYESQQIQKQQQVEKEKNEISEKNILLQMQRGSELICESKWFQADNEQFDEKPLHQSRIPLQDNKNYEQYERRGSNNNLQERYDNNRKRQDHSNNRRQNSNINTYEDENYQYDQNYKGNKGRQSLGDEENRNYFNRPKTVMENPSSQNYGYDSQHYNDFRQQNDQHTAMPSTTFYNQDKNPRNKNYYEDERDLQKSDINNVGRDQLWKGKEMGKKISYDQFRQQNMNQYNNENQFYYNQQQNYTDNNAYRENQRQQQPYIDYDDRTNFYGNGNNKDYSEKNYRMNDYNHDRNRNYPGRHEQYDNYPPQRMYDYDDNYNQFRGQHYNYHNERDYYYYDQNMERSQTFYPPQNRYYNGPHYPPPPPDQYYGNNGYERDYQKQRRVSEFNQDYADNHNYNHYRRQTEFEGYRAEMQYDPSRYQVQNGFQKRQVIYDQNSKRDTSNPRQIHRETKQDQNYVSDNYLRGQRSRSPINHNISQPDNQRYQNQVKNTRQQDQSPLNRHNQMKYPPYKNYQGPSQEEQEVFNNNKNLDQERQKNQQVNNYLRPEQPQNSKRYSDQPDYFKTLMQDERNQRNLDDQHNFKADQKQDDPYSKKSHLNLQEYQKQENRQKPSTIMSEKEYKNQETLKSPISKQKMLTTTDDFKKQQLRTFDEQKGQSTPNQNNQNCNIYQSTNGNYNRNLDFDEKSNQARNQQQYQQQKENVKNYNDYPVGVKNNKGQINFDDIVVGTKNSKNGNKNFDELPVGIKNPQSDQDGNQFEGKGSKNHFEEQPVKQNKNNHDETPVGGKKNNISEMPPSSKYNKNNFDEMPVGPKKNIYDEIPVGNKNNNEDMPVGYKNSKNAYEEMPVGPKSSKHNFNEMPTGIKNNKSNFDETIVSSKNNQNNFEEYPVGSKKANNEQPNRDIKKQGINSQNEKGNNRQNISQQYPNGYQFNNKKMQNNSKLNNYEDDGNESNIDEGPTYLNNKQLQSKNVKTLQGNYEYNDDRPIKSNETQSYDLNNIPQNLQYGQSAPSNSNKLGYNQTQRKNNQQNIKQQQMMSQQPQQKQLFECSQGCGRKFNQESLSKHEKICKKVFQQKRKQFDSQAARTIQGMQELESVAQISSKQQKKNVNQNQNKKEKNDKNDKSNNNNSNKPSWLKQSEAFRMQLRLQRTGETDPESSIKMQDALGYVPCNFCGRKFNKNAAERHIPFCEKKAKEKQVKVTSNQQAASNLNQNGKQQMKQSQSRLQTNQNTFTNKRQ
ncbi:hypothetical protein ABPG72_022269 [Tetrahymena utriculariae]